MKIHLKFDHNKDNLLEAIDSEYSKRDVNKKLAEIVMRFIIDDRLERVSQVCELMHNELDYEIILYLATHHLLETSAKILNNYESI